MGHLGVEVAFLPFPGDRGWDVKSLCNSFDAPKANATEFGGQGPSRLRKSSSTFFSHFELGHQKVAL